MPVPLLLLNLVRCSPEGWDHLDMPERTKSCVCVVDAALLAMHSSNGTHAIQAMTLLLYPLEEAGRCSLQDPFKTKTKSTENAKKQALRNLNTAATERDLPRPHALAEARRPRFWRSCLPPCASGLDDKLNPTNTATTHRGHKQSGLLLPRAPFRRGALKAGTFVRTKTAVVSVLGNRNKANSNKRDRIPGLVEVQEHSVV